MGLAPAGAREDRGRMALTAIFFMGILNFALHRAVTESGHPMLARLPPGRWQRLRRFGLAGEFVVLLGAMLVAENGYGGVAWIYTGYTGANAMSAWMIVSRRM